ncbi:MAG: phosphatase PAP2 family protein [Gammaproteobacteria bacterium]|nr:phosphatase PAP2 family protein [Gammaproteobacteria bacterium]
MNNRDTETSHFWWQHAGIPILLFAIFSLLIIYFEIDFALADALFQWQDQEWNLRGAHWFKTIFHDGGRYLSLSIGLLVLLLWIAGAVVAVLKPYRRGFIYLLIAGLLSSAYIGLLKKFNPAYCPWDLLRYGGQHEYISPFAWSQWGGVMGHCFPAAHASAGYAWIGIYFFCLVYASRYRWHGLVSALLLGTILGFSQQLRGAHFISHDVWTLMICWFNSLFWYAVYLRR